MVAVALLQSNGLMGKDLDVVEGKFSRYFPLPYRVAVIINLGTSQPSPTI